MADADDLADAESVDPSVWREVVDLLGDNRQLVLLSSYFSSAAAGAAAGVSRKMLELLGAITSPKLDPDSWSEPFKPSIVIKDGLQSSIPSDLDDTQRGLLVRVAAALDDSDDPALRARIYDICWTYHLNHTPSMMAAAVDAYSSVPLEPGTWHGDGREQWQRAFELAKRGSVRVETLTRAVLERLRRSTLEDHYFGVELSEFARTRRMVETEDLVEFAQIAVSIAQLARAAESWALARSWEGESAAWYSAIDRDSASRAFWRLALDFASEAADRRCGTGGDATTAAYFTAPAIAVLRKLPREFRIANGIDQLITDLNREMEDDRQALIGSMKLISGGSMDISHVVASSQRQVSKLDPIAALGRLAFLMPLADPTEVEATALDVIARHPVQMMLAAETYRRSGQKVAATPAIAFDHGGEETVTPDPRVWAVMVRNHLQTMHLYVVGLIVPAMQVITLEHRYSSRLMYSICQASSAIPPGHEGLWALGLQRGLDDDFASAASLLVPQIENLVRIHLKAHGVQTLVTNRVSGVETEKGLGILLDDPGAEEVLGKSMVFELKALLTDQSGPNLRNDIAHGLADDQALNSMSVVYAWWLSLRFVLGPADGTSHLYATG